MTNTKRNIAFASALAVLVLVIAAVGATLAFLTDKKVEQTSIQVGTLKIHLADAVWEAGMKPANTDFNELFPGKTIPRNPVVTLDAGCEPCYVRLKVTIDDALAKVIDPPRAEAGWTRTNGPSANEYYYTFGKPLKAGETTPAAFKSIYVLLSNPDISKMHEDWLDAADNQEIHIEAQAVQAAGLASTPGGTPTNQQIDDAFTYQFS